MDVVDPCMVLLIMVNEDPRAEIPCSACGPTVMFTVYGWQMDSCSTKMRLIIAANI